MVELLGGEPAAAALFDRSGNLLRRAESTSEVVLEQGEAGPRWLQVVKIPQANGEELRVVVDVTENMRAAALRALLAMALPPASITDAVVSRAHFLFAELLMAGAPLAEVAKSLDLSLEQVAGTCIRLARA